MLTVLITYLLLFDSVWPTWWQMLPIIVLDLVCLALSGSRCVLTCATEVCKSITLIIRVCQELALYCCEFFISALSTYCDNSETKHLTKHFTKVSLPL